MTEERKRNEARVSALADSHARNLRAVREDLTRILAPDDDNTVYPSGPIESPYVKVPIGDPYLGQFDRLSNLDRYAYIAPMQTIDLKAVQNALILPNGTKVVWYGWAMA